MSAGMPGTCAYCGLPVRTATAEGPCYCCFGCRLAASVTGATAEEGQARWTLLRLGLALFFTLNVVTFSMALWTGDVYGPGAGQGHALADPLLGLYRWLCFAAAMPVLFLLGEPLLEGALASLRQGQFTTDPLLLLGVAAAYVYSALSVLRDSGPIYFEVGCIILVLVTLGRWFEATSKLRATRALDELEHLLPERVRVVTAGGQCEKPLAEVRSHEELRVLAGERIPCDGLVQRQPASVDEQILTGEAVPHTREVGAEVYAGTLNLESDLYLLVTAPPGAGTLDRLRALLQQARLMRGQYQQLADRLANWFLPLVTMIALATVGVHSWLAGPDQGILAGLAVLLIACPCALGIATPLVVWLALNEAARRQILFRSGAVLEQLAQVRGVAFDKTGTLTRGAAKVAEMVIAWGTSERTVLERALLLALASRHTLARAVVDYCEQGRKERPLLTTRFGGSGLEDATTEPASSEADLLTSIQTLPGRGLQAFCQRDQETTWLGSPRLMQECGQSFPPPLRQAVEQAQKEARPLVCLGWGGTVRAVFLIAEELRPEAQAALTELQQLGLQVEVLTGDHRARGARLEQELGVPVRAELLPEDKLTELQRLQENWGPVAMVGDGINDGPALAASAVGIALGCGADVTRAAAGVCLLGNDLRQVAWVWRLARLTVQLIRQNLFWAVFYNSIGIALACTGRLNPVLAAVAMVLSSVLILGNSFRLPRRLDRH